MKDENIVKINILRNKNFSRVFNYWRENYPYDNEYQGLIQWFIGGAYILYTYNNIDGSLDVSRFIKVLDDPDYRLDSWSREDYALKDWCEQDFQDILSPTQNELVLFELKYGFEFPFQEKNMKHPIMVTIYPRTTECPKCR